MDLSKSLHPRVYAAVDAWEQQFYSLSEKSEAFQQASARHQNIWLKTYGAKILLQGAAAGLANAAVCGSIAWMAGGSEAAAAAMLAAGGVGWLAQTFWFLHRNRRTVTPEELRNLLPTLTLSPLEKVYSEAIIALAENPQLTDADKEAIAHDLNGLLDAQLRLEEQRATIFQALGEQEDRAGLEAERDALQKRLRHAIASGNADPVTRNALEQSLALCEQRLASRDSLEPGLARLDAQSELIRQAMHSLRESLARLKAAPALLAAPVPSAGLGAATNAVASAPTDEMEDIKRRITGMTNQARSVEKAVEEILMLRGKP